MLSLVHRYYDPLRLPSRNAPFHLYRFIGLFFTAITVRGRVSLVPDTTVTTCRSLYTGEFFRAVSKFFTRSMAFTRTVGARLSLDPYGLRLSMRQDSQLHVTACSFASQGFDRRISPPSRLLATEQLGLYSDRTFTGKLYLALLGAHGL